MPVYHRTSAPDWGRNRELETFTGSGPPRSVLGVKSHSGRRLYVFAVGTRVPSAGQPLWQATLGGAWQVTCMGDGRINRPEAPHGTSSIDRGGTHVPSTDQPLRRATPGAAWFVAVRTIVPPRTSPCLRNPG